jgi:hypothetical protein
VWKWIFELFSKTLGIFTNLKSRFAKKFNPQAKINHYNHNLNFLYARGDAGFLFFSLGGQRMKKVGNPWFRGYGAGMRGGI